MLLALLLAVSVPWQTPTDVSKFDDGRARKGWSYLTEGEQEDALARFEGEVAELGTFQLSLVKYARSLEERDLGFLPQAAETPYFDPAVHAPGQPIARHRLPDSSSAAKAERKRMFAKIPERRMRNAWRYDWGTREIVRCGELDSRERRFENALAGYPPGLDLTEALIERALDDGAQQKVLAAFEHAYTDRSGSVFPGVTLYDAWASGEDMEMPDVDVLGIVHDVLGEWKKWIAPVAPAHHDELYAAVGKLFQSANRHRELRVALARVFARGVPEMRPPYSTCIDRFHALWEASASTPSAVAKLLPEPDVWSEFLADWSLKNTGKLRDAALARRQRLVDDERAVHESFLRILADAGAFTRTSRPQAK